MILPESAVSKGTSVPHRPAWAWLRFGSSRRLEAKNEGMANHQACKRRSWHHRMALVAIALRFRPGNASPDATPTPLLRCSDIDRPLGHFPPGATSTLRTRFGRWQSAVPKGALGPGGDWLPSASRCLTCPGVI